ncbi:hypothetical protein JCM17844_08690 [Iodidimonas gelatinilytica]|uniref:Phage shock protein PspC N-terminal domain-containing protein n=2 Tax=Iodidimonas gelatinilytica TaxID=1236966 RepID=A0A5A7MW55_9PROT|nr:hypothetical protein JCM17844_08690 [Iodidimonas gelatinilytica]GEQ99563.1 hypothetical protein JCM17845_01870 [Iodidimonas gelatinilytica]
MKRFSPNKLYKDPANGKIMGVCAGLADYTGIKATSSASLLWLAV